MALKISKGSNEIVSVEDWFQYAPPKKGILQWKDGRSTKELARAWFRNGIAEPPGEFRSVLESKFGALDYETAEPECVITLDRFGGEHRNCDLVLQCSNAAHRLAVSVEAKADEPFGDELIGMYYDRMSKNPASNVPKRIDGLVHTLFGRTLDESIRGVRYQLLHGAVGALIVGERLGATDAVFLVHKFMSPWLNPRRVSDNQADWAKFAILVGGSATEFDQHEIRGPFKLPEGGRFNGVRLFLASVTTHV